MWGLFHPLQVYPIITKANITISSIIGRDYVMMSPPSIGDIAARVVRGLKNVIHIKLIL